MPPVDVLKTYLQLESRADFKPVANPDPRARVEQVHGAPASFFRYLYVEVGRAWHWVDRLPWTDDELRARLAQPGVTLHLLSVAGAPAGYFELEKHEDGSVEVAYFGLLPEFLGRRLGAYLLSEAVSAAWALAPTRVWLHTCTLDAKAALPNYLARGFRPFKEERYVAQMPD
jgi:GNAT superfamily N-acetyltransferase